jgi:formiminotetrahydrofolate cyclodeaminase
MYSIDSLIVSEYLEKMAEPGFPSPVGGSAVATSAAMAAALVEMACKVTMNKDEKKRNLMEPLKNVEAIRKHCLFLATEDMKALSEVIRVAKSKNEFPDEFEVAMKNATDTLVSIVRDCNSILTQIEQGANTWYIKVLGELAVSTYMAEAAAAAAKRAVEVNLHLLRDENYKKDVLNVINESYRKSSETKNRILAAMAD